LAASPDGLIGDDSIIEIKCPISIKDLTPKDAYNEKKLSFMEVQLDNLILKKTHIYYYQVQGQLRITNRTFCYFIVWTPKGKIMFFSVIIILCYYLFFYYCRNLCW